MTATPHSSTNDSMLRNQLSKYTSAVTSFASSNSKFQILHSLPTKASVPPPKTLYILDSSFNPPTLAHLRIASSALLQDSHPSASSPKRLLLLLATQNADKAPKPATFEQRLLMMQIFAQDLLFSFPSRTTKSPTQEPEIGIDIAVTTLPYFVDKYQAISSSTSYPSNPIQVHLTGFDTLIRILDPKYYPPSHTLESLHPFLDKHRLRVTYRTDDNWGGREAQDEYLRDIGEGRREKEGAKSEWIGGGRVVMCEGKKEGEEIISSTKVRDAVKNGDKELLKHLVTGGVAKYILREGLYLED